MPPVRPFSGHTSAPRQPSNFCSRQERATRRTSPAALGSTSFDLHRRGHAERPLPYLAQHDRRSVPVPAEGPSARADPLSRHLGKLGKHQGSGSTVPAASGRSLQRPARHGRPSESRPGAWPRHPVR
eukprot:scaffold7029_cov375-Pinguiococcus_pyrenoidosus.AAC.2